jgi:lipopolysaccharide transport system permease protein
MSKANESELETIVIEPKSGWQAVDFKELREYRDLLFFLVWRDVKVLYVQTILGLSWAILQPVIQILLFTVVFGRIAKIPTDGIPYVLFSTVAVIPWTYLHQAMERSSDSLVAQQRVLGKIYFPRLIFPLTPILSKLIDFGISMVLIVCVMVYYRVPPSWNLLLFPVFTLMMVCICAGVGMALSSLSIRFRDVRHALPFVVRMLMYSAPIVYSASSIPETYRFLYSLNPLVGVIEGFRACLLGTEVPWQYIWPGSITALMLLIGGAFYFRRMERVFVDVI